MVTCNIVDWQAWSPYASELAQWRQWCAGEPLEDSIDKPALNWVNPMLRRRLSFLSRLMLDVAHRISAERQIDSWVFASRHGELQTTVQVLRDIARQEPLSPMAFSLSVHNTGAGLFSIAGGVQAPMTAVAAGRDTLIMALYEGIAKHRAHQAETVAVIYAEERIADDYTNHQDGDADALALALLIGDSGQPLTIEKQAESYGVTSNGEAMIRLLAAANGEESAALTGEQGRWIVHKGR